MKAYIELKNGYWLVNDKRSGHWTWEEKELMSAFFKIVKTEEQEPPKSPSLLGRLGGAFFRKKKPSRYYELTKKGNFLLIRQIH